MKLAIIGLMALCFSVCSFGFANETFTDKTTGEVFPKDVSFEYDDKKYELQATGSATRKKFFFKVYSIAHYLQKGVTAPASDKFQPILSDDYAKQLTMKWVRDVGSDKVQEAFQESFHKIFSEQEYGKLSGEISNFLKFFQRNAVKGDEYILRWIPGGIVEVLVNGNKVGSVTSKEFAKGLWTIWFGPKSVVDRNDLVALM